MAEEPSGPFRKKSLERLSSPERLDQLLQVTDQRTWVPLITLSVLSFGLLVWAVVGEIPIHVEGRGILVRPHKVVEFQAPGDGQVLRLSVRVGDRVERKDVLALLARPDLEKRLELQQDKLAELTGRARDADLLRSRRTEVESSSSRSQSERLREHIRASRELAENLKEMSLQAIAEERTLLEEQWRLASELPVRLKETLDAHGRLADSALISKVDLVKAEEAYVESLARVSDLEAQLNQLRTRELEVNEEYQGRLQRISDRTFELQGLAVREEELAQQNYESAASYDEQVSETQREIARLEDLIAQESEVVAEQPGRILELSALIGQELERGDRVGSMEVDDPDSPLTSLTYFTVRDGKQVEGGDRILVTPDTAERERHGSIKGRVTSVSVFPVSPAEVEQVVGNQMLAESLIAGGYLMQVQAELKLDPEAPDRYEWSSSRGSDLPVTVGTTTTSRVRIEDRSPISFVLPFLRSASGID